jgi:hypothetical protein
MLPTENEAKLLAALREIKYLLAVASDNGFVANCPELQQARVVVRNACEIGKLGN